MATSGVLSFGRISEFQPELESIETYEQRVRMFLQANDVTDKAVPVLLSIIGASNFALLSSLLAPEKPADKTVDELLETLRAHFTQKRVTIVERYKFYNRSQGQDESAAQFAGELRRLATHCNFGSFLEQALRDRFVCGLKNTAAQKKLLSGADKADGDKLTFKMAIETASTMETVETDLQELNLRKNNPVLQVQPRNKTCSRCSREGHEPRNCRLLVWPVARRDTSRSPVEQMGSQSSRGRLQYEDYKTRLGLILMRMRCHQKTLVFSNCTQIRSGQHRHQWWWK